MIMMTTMMIMTTTIIMEEKDNSKLKKRSFWRVLLDGLCSFAVWLSRAIIKTTGFDNLPEDGKFLMVSNHVSAYDPIILVHLLKKQRMMFVSKPENFKIPICGFLMRKSGFKAINRESPREALPTIYESAEVLKTGTPVVIYPEGTRNKEPEKGLLPFHNGVFKIAKRANAPVYVCATIGTEKISGNMPWRRTDVEFKIVDIIDSEFVAANQDKQIGDRVYEALNREIYS